MTIGYPDEIKVKIARIASVSKVLCNTLKLKERSKNQPIREALTTQTV
tara:strand:+ start:371 stop:514 length:144 start_codon:yes stop_codon:yes gene_type:complete